MPISHYWDDTEVPISHYWHLSQVPISHYWHLSLVPISHYWNHTEVPISHYLHTSPVPISHYWHLSVVPICHYWDHTEVPISHCWHPSRVPIKPTKWNQAILSPISPLHHENPLASFCQEGKEQKRGRWFGLEGRAFWVWSCPERIPGRSPWKWLGWIKFRLRMGKVRLWVGYELVASMLLGSQ